MDDSRPVSSAVVMAMVLVTAGNAHGNDIQPRLFTNIPVGTNFLGVLYTRSEGSVAVDPSLALDVEAELDTYVAGPGQGLLRRPKKRVTVRK